MCYLLLTTGVVTFRFFMNGFSMTVVAMDIEMALLWTTFVANAGLGQKDFSMRTQRIISGIALFLVLFDYTSQYMVSMCVCVWVYV
jgi:hypothetical protein